MRAAKPMGGITTPMRTRALTLPRPLPIAVLFMIVLGLALTALPVEAAPKGSVIKPTVQALNTIVSPEEPAAFQTTFTNTGSSTITDLFLNVSVSGGTLPATLPSGCTASNGSTTTATCSLGTLSSGAATVTHLFLVTASEPPGGIGALTFDATYSGDARQNNEQAAKRDTWVLPTATTVVDTSAEVFGSWQNAHGSKGYPAVVGALQTTAVNVPAIANAYAALVQHLDDNLRCGPGRDFDGFGKTVELRVNNGNSPVEVTITYTAAADAPSPSQVDLIHLLDNGDCVFVARDCAANAGHANGCFDVRVEGTGQNKLTIVDAQLPSNGRVKGG